jgi:KUP system potassium uptake protein
LVLRAENDGEGGVFALYGLLHRFKNTGTRVLLWALLLRAGLLLGDGMITPSISLLSAVEGLDVVTPACFRLFVLLRRLSRPAYDAYQLGDQVQLSAEIMPVQVK